MGNDGGSINRTKSIRTETKASRQSTGQVTEYNWENLWCTCRLSGNALTPPLFSDCKGNLFNKESILEWLLVKPEYKSDEYTELIISRFSHIKLRKDLVEISNLTQRQDGSIGVSLAGNGEDLVLGKGKKFGYLDVCGHVNLLGILENRKECAVCGRHYEDDNIVMINPLYEQDIGKLRDREIRLVSKQLSHSRKPLKRMIVGEKKKSLVKKRKVIR